MFNKRLNQIAIIFSILYLIAVICIILILPYIIKEERNFTVNSNKAIDSLTTIALEQAYFDGQLDAINNDIRIKFNPKLNSYEWIKSPWDSNRKPLFIPDSTDNKGI